ncbi:PEGA domain-containing protein [Deinococcus budaensis]|uniref:PEGA domain-containing protein n=1 Tax=Deinococcus budaensis TaxID=1665626 RepID=A0A7W8GGC7_9DEIO|nr:PEGA domain-containing protein [Deinococcus budaensis]MBB5235095.1 hypothetical protein [Deinococcus budaensis]
MKPIGPYVAARDLTGDRPAGAVRTLRATDRLTGMPVLLHVLPHVAPLPELPQHPALLRPSEGGLDGDVAYVVTELPPHALPAADPLLAARGALAGLAALHEAGQTHGGVEAAQLWSVDGRVALAGAGLPWGGEPSAAGDLRDLRGTLEALGGLPPALRGAPEDASARDLLARLDAPGVTAEEQAEAAPAPALADATPLPTPGAAPESTVKVIVAAPGPDPGPDPGDAARPAALDTVAPSPEEGRTGEATAASPAPPAPVPLPDSTRRRIGEPVRIAWNADGTRRVVKPGREGALPPRARPRRPAWLWPALVLLGLLALAAALWAQRAAPGAAASEPGTLSAAAETCCPVRFTVRGEPGIPVRLSVIQAPPGANLPAGRDLGRAPGTVQFPRPGTYTLRVAAEGFTPGRVTVTAPSAAPVTIDLAP